jgi:hypothetical protein
MAKSPIKLPQISPWLWAALAAVAGVVTAQIYGRGAFFLVAGGAVLVGAIAILWNSLLSLTGEAPLTLDEALSLAAPSAEEERKESVLRALKDLDYERNVGKLSEDDYRELSRRYRQDAKQLLQLVDESLAPARARAIEQLEERLKDLPHATPEEPAKPAAGASADEPAAEKKA